MDFMQNLIFFMYSFPPPPEFDFKAITETSHKTINYLQKIFLYKGTRNFTLQQGRNSSLCEGKL